MSEKEDFYLVLPSNSCPLTQPDNNASYFIVDWQNAIDLHGTWEAALTEFTYLFQPITLEGNTYFTYKYKSSIVENNYEFTLNRFNKTELQFHNQTHQIGMHTLIHLIRDNKFCFELDHIPSTEIEIAFNTLEEAKLFGFNKRTNKFAKNSRQLIGENNISTKIIPGVNYKVSFLSYIISENDGYVYIPTNIECKNVKELTEAIVNLHSYPKTHPPFESILVNDEGKVQFNFMYYVRQIEFPQRFSKFINLEHYKYRMNENHSHTIITNSKVTIPESKLTQLYIYSSLVNPILVGGVQVPLLRVIPINKNLKHGEMYSSIIERPMYIPISTSSINNIEINIRDDSGRLINFSYGSKTILTIHLRKRK